MLTVEQRIASLEDCITLAVDAGGKRLRCACPGIVQEWNSTTQTVSVKLAIKEVLSIEGVETETEIPMLVDVPVVMPRAGGYCLLMVPQAGDECLVVFSDLCIDAWYQSGGIQSQAERRRHDLSDGFAIMGCWSQVRKPTFPTSGISLQKDDGSAKLTIDSNGIQINGEPIGIKDVDSNDYGVAIGQTSTATSSAKKFEVASDHTTYIYGDAELQGSTKITSLTHLGGRVYDTGWVDISSYLDTSKVTISATSESNNTTPYCRRVGDIVYMRGAVRVKNDLADGSSLAIFTSFPADFRPSPNMNMRIPIIGDTGLFFLRIGTSDTVIINYSDFQLNANSNVHLECSWMM